MPTIHGEDAVIRILDKEQINEEFKNLNLDVVGFAEEDMRKFRRYIRRALRHGAGDRPDRLRQDHDAVRRAQRNQKRRRQDHHRSRTRSNTSCTASPRFR